MKKTDPSFSAEQLSSILVDESGVLPGSRLVVALSGGLDSCVLLHALACCRQRHNWSLRAIHIDHGLQADSSQWTKFCDELCKQLKVPIQVKPVLIDTASGSGIEAEARKQRYAALSEMLQTGEILLTAHHRDDQVETLLLQLFRGAGVTGLASMPASTTFAKGKHNRPLLAFTRQALRDYAIANRLDWVEDSSNQDSRYARNYLRHDVMPLLKSHWNNVDVVLARTTGHMADASKVLDEVAQQDLHVCQDDVSRLMLPRLQLLSDSRLRNLLRYWIRRHHFYSPASRHLQQIVECVRRPDCHQASINWKQAQVHRYRNHLYLTGPLPAIDPEMTTKWDMQRPISITAIGYTLTASSERGVGLSQQKLRHRNVVIRFRRGGEVCLLPGRDHHHKLKKLFQQAGIPPWMRRRLPLVYADDELAAIGDRWVCQPFAAAADEPGFRLLLQKTGGSDSISG